LLGHEGIIKSGFYTRLSMNVVVRLVTADAVIVRYAILVFARVAQTYPSPSSSAYE
jgi:hypothetical protein